jgi:hypothetical protein
MNTTPNDNATSWRDLADQLTPEQRKSYANLERETQGRMPAQRLLEFVREEVEGNLADMAYCDVPAPADANWVGKWEKNRGEGWSRSLVWRGFRAPEMCVAIDGNQQCDGTVERQISVYLNDDPKLDAGPARRLAALLVDAAAELDRLQ